MDPQDGSSDERKSAFCIFSEKHLNHTLRVSQDKDRQGTEHFDAMAILTQTGCSVGRRLTLRGQGDYGALKASAVIKMPAAGSRQTVQLEVNQVDGSDDFGIVLGCPVEASSNWQVELLKQ